MRQPVRQRSGGAAGSVCIGLLRAVNLAGRNMIAMSDLRDLLTQAGLGNPRTLLQSGNVVFDAGAMTPGGIERVLQKAAKAHLGLETEFFVRTAAEWAGVIEANPFPKEAKSDPGHLLVVVLKESPDPAAVSALQKAIRGREVVRAAGRQAYITYPDGVGRSRLTSAMIEKALGTRGTARNWNTVMKLAALAVSSVR